MRIFYSFLIMLTSVILILLPITSAVYDFRTDLREDDVVVITPVSSTNATIQLFKALYDNDTSTVAINSDDVNDAPLMSSYNTTTRAMLVTGLADNTTRTITVAYDINVIEDGSINTLLDALATIWIILWIALPIAGLVAIWTGKA